MSRIDSQIARIKDRADFREIVDGLDDDAIAILVVRHKAEGENQLRLRSFGTGQETEYLGLLGYASVIMHREYFSND